MFDLGPEAIALLMMGSVFVIVLTGYPLAFSFGALALYSGLTFMGLEATSRLLYERMFSMFTNYILLSVPLFIFMGNMLERSGIAERLYDAIYVWFGGLRGGLAITTIVIGAILAACVGVIAAPCAMLAVVALPAMVNRGYTKSLASGSVCAAGSLGILIPPSVMLVVYGPMAEISVGKLFFGAFVPGFLLAFCYCVYILLRGYIQPHSAPALPPEERTVPFWPRTKRLVVSVAPTALLVASVLGSIFFGIAPPTEAASVGALCAVLLTLMYRTLTWKALVETTVLTMRMSSFILLIAAAANAFTGVFLAAGGGQGIKNLILAMPGGKWGFFLIIHLIVFLLGFFIDWIGIVFIIVPIISPIVPTVGFDPVWFALLLCINMQTAFMTPPFASAIFFVMGSAPKELNITMRDIIMGVIPFILIVLAVVTMCVLFPQIVLWLPNQMIG
jgi:tripartite ATP-independent transporter DctM subunit